MEIDRKQPVRHPELAELRLDKWLWAARLYKTRAMAAKAVSGGKVELGDRRTKPAKPVRVGDTLRITRGIFEQHITVLLIKDRRRPAVEAKQMYVESEQSVTERQQLLARLRAERALPFLDRTVGRPNKKQRRQIISFTKRRSES